MTLFIDCNHPGTVYVGEQAALVECDAGGGQSWPVSRAEAVAYLGDGWGLMTWGALAGTFVTLVSSSAPAYPDVEEVEESEELDYASRIIELAEGIKPVLVEDLVEPSPDYPSDPRFELRVARAKTRHGRFRRANRSRARLAALREGMDELEYQAVCFARLRSRTPYEER